MMKNLKKKVCKTLKFKNFLFKKIDIRKNVEVQNIFKKYKPKVVIHLGSSTWSKIFIY